MTPAVYHPLQHISLCKCHCKISFSSACQHLLWSGSADAAPRKVSKILVTQGLFCTDMHALDDYAENVSAIQMQSPAAWQEITVHALMVQKTQKKRYWGTNPSGRKLQVWDMIVRAASLSPPVAHLRILRHPRHRLPPSLASCKATKACIEQSNKEPLEVRRQEAPNVIRCRFSSASISPPDSHATIIQTI